MTTATPEGIETRYVDTPDALRQLCQSLQGQPWIALDTEFLREKTYYPRLCLIQLAVPGLAACVDPLALESLEPLLDCLYDRSMTKVLHASSQDLEIFHGLRGALPGPLFDTQLAAPLLGLQEQLGYGGLVKELLGISLDKGHARTDWTARPLSARQIRYALDDVIYLAELYPQLLERLQTQGRLAWLAADFERLEDPARYRTAAGDAWLRIRGHERLKPRALGVLQALAAWREDLARSQDRPRNWILRDDILMDLARLQPDSRQALQQIRNFPEKTLHRHGDDVLSLIAEASGRAPATAPAAVRRERPSAREEALADALHAQLRLIADRHAINPAVVASRKQLLALVQGERDMPVLEGWRREVAGAELLAMLEGDRTLSVRDGQLQVATPEQS